MNDDITSLKNELDLFIEQDDHSTLMLLAAINDLVVPAKLLEAVGRQSEEIVILAVHAFNSAQQWVNELAQLLQMQVDAANGHRTSEGLEVWPALPMSCMNPNLDPGLRLKNLAEYCTSVIPENERVIWTLLPNACSNSMEYQRTVAILCGSDKWLDSHRFIIWEDKNSRALLDVLIEQQNEDVLVIDIDFSAPKQLNNLVDIVNDEGQPEADRIEALFQLAAVDFAYKRHEMAYEKYKVLFQYYEGKDKIRQAMCLLGSGDIALERKCPERALPYYQSGIAMAIEEDSMPVLLPLLIGAGKANIELQYYEDAEGYFDNANQIAAKLMNPYVKADVLELRGLAQIQQNKARDAIESWNASAGLSEKFSYKDRWESALNHLVDLYKKIGDQGNLFIVETRIRKGMQSASDEKSDTAAGKSTSDAEGVVV